MERVEYESTIIQDLLGYYERKELNLNPWYQRRSVWTRPQKAYLINTIHENKPVPSIYIRHYIDFDSEKSVREVVDGQQRVRCVIQYKNNEFRARHPNYSSEKYYQDLTQPERIHFLQSALSVGYLVGASDADVIEIFARINTVSKTLNPQEKRNANFSGAFKQFCLSQAILRLPFWRQNRIFTDTQIARMLEVQFVSDLIMNLMEGLQDFSAERLNRFYELYEEECPFVGDIEARLDRIFSLLLTLPSGLLGRTIFSSPQILFSLILVIDSQQSATPEEILRCVEDLDAMIEEAKLGIEHKFLTATQYQAFTSGNLHRIRSRYERHEKINTFFL